jgi:hypothetical protein
MNNLIRSPFRCIIEHYNQKGVIIKRSSFIPNSVVQAYIGILTVQFYNSGLSLKDTSGATNSCNPTQGNLNIMAAVNDDTYGIVVGSGTNSVTINDYKLQSKILQGIGADLLQYSTMEIPSLYVVNSSKAFTSFRRLFTNLSGSSITVNELGIYCNAYNNKKYCLERTLYNSVLADEEALSVTYVLEKEIL